MPSRLQRSSRIAAAPAAAPPQADIDRLVAAYSSGQLAAAAALGEALATAYPHAMLAHNLLGATYLALAEPARAEAAFRRALACNDRHPAIHNNLGMALAGQNRTDEAIAAYRRACKIDPRHASARNNLGNVLKDCGRLDEAVVAYRQAIAIQPDFADAHCNLALALHAIGRLDEAGSTYRRALALKPDHAQACNNLGNLLADQGKPDEAIAAYRQALQLKPDYADALLNLGNLHKRCGNLAEAGAAYGRAQAIDPRNPDIRTEQGKLLVLEGRLDEAIAAFGQALAIRPDNATARLLKLYHQIQICDWTAFEAFGRLNHNGELPDDAISPFAALVFEDDPERQLARSRAWARASFRPAPAPLPRKPATSGGKIRIGYFSADFHNHATLYLMSGLLREHDHDRFEIFAYSYGHAADDAMRHQLLASVDHFSDIRQLSDVAAVALARSHGLDIAIDLKGYTLNTRSQLFASRLAPVQISYLGYPGSMGAEFIDYLVADPVVIPPASRAAYSEKLLLLPYSYQANDNQRPIATKGPGRAEAGLPEQAFVFCCFNHCYKIGPREFAIWMRLLAWVPGSVLWLLRSNRWAEANLRARAAEVGIEPARIVFAESLPHDEHLARLQLADLFLDTFNVNAHTTASDALWAGLPIVSMAGRQFAALVGASLLAAAGLAELICDSEAAYEALCLDLAARPEKLAAFRAILATEHEALPLFDTLRYTRHLESAYEAVHRRAVAGLAPDHLTIG